MDMPPDQMLETEPIVAKRLSAQWVQQVILSELASLDTAPNRLTVSGPVSASEFSRIYRGEGTAFDCPVAIKLFLRDQSNGPPDEVARTYYLALHQLWTTAAADPKFSVARPLGLIEGLGIVVTEWVDGPTLASCVLRSSRSEGLLASRKAGMWLGRLHAIAGVSRRPVDIDRGMLQLQTEISDDPRWRSRATIFRALRMLLQAAPSFAGQTVTWSRSHGDFKPVNLIMRDGVGVGIDLDLVHMTPTVHDAAHFLNHLNLLFWSAGGIGRLRTAPGLVEAFCEGYTVDAGMELSRLPLAWERLRNAVHLLLRNREWSRPPRSWIAGLALARLVRTLTNELAELLDNHHNRQPRAEAGEPPAPSPVRAPTDAQARVDYLEDVLMYLVEDDDTWFSPDSDRLLFEALNSSARSRG